MKRSLKKIIPFFLFVYIISLMTGCGSKADVTRAQKLTADFSGGWSAVESSNYIKADEIFSTIIATEQDPAVINEAYAGLAFISLSNPEGTRLVNGNYVNNIVAAQLYLEKIYFYSYETIFEPVYSTKINNSDARAMLAMTYQLTGNTERFNSNLNIAKVYSGRDIDSEHMLQSLDELLNGI
ncbi:MAG: hypothetical protein WC002_01530 [Candidatus Muiribacteriota bacterium]